MSSKVFVALSTFAKQGKAPLELLEQSGLDFDVNPNGKRLTADQVIELAGGFEGIVAGLEPYDSSVLEKLSNLRCISRCGVGIDNVDLLKAKEQGIEVRNTPDVVIQPVAELTVGFIFDLLKRTTAHTMLMRDKCWERLTGNMLQGKKVGVLGLGRIGRRTAEMLSVLGAEVYGADLYVDNDWAEKYNVKVLSTNELIAQSEVLTIHLAGNAEAPFQLTKDKIAAMPEGAFVVNVARGEFIDEPALVEALQSKHLAGAALDVYSEEPYTGPLCDLDNVVLTPHVATLTRESRVQMEYQATKNLLDFLKESNS